ncbi:MAG: adenylate/guanylate cyclase domain-containing protein [Chloroflexota bacterium]|nr:adenylate/guanylate cyclase domain-containing protein [Chloroflexota bacterium]
MQFTVGLGRKERRLRIASALTVAAACVYLIIAAMFNPARRLQDAFADALFQSGDGSRNVLIVAIDDNDLAREGRLSTWPRSLHADAIRRLHDAGARVIVYDVLFADEGPDDAILAAAVSDAGNVVLASGGGVASVPASAGAPLAYNDFTLPTASLRVVALAVAHSNIETDADGRVRRVPLEVSSGDGSRYPALALAALYVQFGRPIPDVVSPESGSLPLFGRSVPVERNETLRVNYVGGRAKFPTLTFGQLLSGEFDASMVRDKIVLVGLDASGVDRHSAPLLNNAAGIEIHANAIDTLLRARFLRQTDSWVGLVTGLIMAAIAALVLIRWRAVYALLFVLAAGTLYLAGASTMFYQGRIINAVDPPITLVIAVLFGLVYRTGSERAAQRELVDLFGRHVSNDVCAELMRQADLGALHLGGELREVTVLFCDVRGFTAMSVNTDPAEIVRLLNARFDIIVQCISRNGGIVNKFVGDAVMAFWNAPRRQDGHAYLACKAAIEALNQLDAMPACDPPMRFGFGIATGDALAGNVGSAGRFEYTLMGETVNTSSRLSGAAPGGETWISANTRRQLGDLSPVDDIPAQSLKGMPAPIQVFRLRRASREAIVLREGEASA